MQRVTISLDDELAAAFDKLIARQGYENRSEAMRDLIRQRMREVENRIVVSLPVNSVQLQTAA